MKKSIIDGLFYFDLKIVWIRKGRAERSEAKIVRWTIFRTRLAESNKVLDLNKELYDNSRAQRGF